MPHRVKSDEHGDILIPHDAFTGGRPNASYEVEQDGSALRSVPVVEPTRPPADRSQPGSAALRAQAFSPRSTRWRIW